MGQSRTSGGLLSLLVLLLSVAVVAGFRHQCVHDQLLPNADHHLGRRHHQNYGASHHPRGGGRLLEAADPASYRAPGSPGSAPLRIAVNITLEARPCKPRFFERPHHTSMQHTKLEH